MTVIVTAVFYPKAGKKAELAEAMQRGIAAVHTEQGCELYSIHEAPDGTILMIEKWATQADLDAHLAGEPVRAYRDARAPFEERTPQLEILTPLEGADPERGMI